MKITYLFLLGLFVFPSLGVAQEEETFTRVVILGRGDHQNLNEALESFDPQIEIRGQTWFLKKVKSRGIRPKKLFKRPKDLTFILEMTETDFVFTLSADGKKKYNVKIYDQSGTIIKEMSVKGKEGISKKGAAKVRAFYETLVELPAEEPEEEEEEKEKEQEESEEVEVKEELKVKSEEKPSGPTTSNISIALSGGLFKRDFEVDSPDGALLSYNSNFYPGAQFEGAFLFGDEKNRPGIFVRAVGAFDSVSVEKEGKIESSSLLQIDAELGGFFLFSAPLLDSRLRGSVQHSRFQIDVSALPTTTYTTLNIDAEFLFHNLFAPGASLSAHLGFTPFGLFQDGGSLFGESSFIYGFRAGLGGIYALSDSLVLRGDFQMRNLRSSFSGNGESEFADSHAFDFTQSAILGVELKF